MAEKKELKKDPKKDKKKEEVPAHSPALELIFWVVIVLFIISLINQFFFAAPGSGGTGRFAGVATRLFPVFISILSTVSVVSVFISLLCLMGFIYATFKVSQIKKMARLMLAERAQGAQVKDTGPILNSKWQKIIEHSDSENPSDWKLAIIEADVVLEQMLEKMGYPGLGIGEKLKQVEKNDFITIDDAWEAHKVRNLIAHQGEDYVLNQRETKRVIGLYQKVFEEFFVI